MPFDLSLQIYTFFVFLRTISVNYFCENGKDKVCGTLSYSGVIG